MSNREPSSIRIHTRSRSRFAAQVLAAATTLSVVVTLLVFINPQVSSASGPIADINLGTATSFSSVSSGALTVGAGANVAGSAVVAPGSASTSGLGASVGAAVAGIAQAQADLAAAYEEAAARTPTANFGGDISGMTFTSGVYRATAAIANNTVVTLDAKNNPDAVFIFQIGAAFSNAAASSMVLLNGAQARHVYWQVLGAVTIGAGATFAGTILAKGAITVGADTIISGRTLSTDGAVSLGAGMGTLGVPEISLTNTASPFDLVFDGETISYTFVVSNSGNVALTVPPLTLSGVDGISQIIYAWSGTPGTLLPKESVTATATYVATFANAVHRSVTASAVIAGTSSTDVIVLAARSKTVVVWPIPVVDTVTVSQGVPTSFDVFTNDHALADVVGFSRTQLGAHPRAIGGAKTTVPSAPPFGSVTCAETGDTRGFCTYTSAQLFTGTDGFDYSVSQLGRSWNVHVTVTVNAVAVSPSARNDRAVATTGGAPVSIRPLANDTHAGPGSLVIVSSEPLPAGQGTLTCSALSCVFFPPTNGFVGTVVANYLVAAQSGSTISALTASASITIFVDAVAATPQGFTSSPGTTPIVDAGTWMESSIVAEPSARCVAGRPQTVISWNPSARATSWAVERRAVSRIPGAGVSPWTAIAVVPGASSTFLDDRVGESNDFQYRVRPDLYRWEGVASDASSIAVTPDAISAAGC